MGLFITKALVERGQGGGEAGRPAVHRRTLTNKERAKAKYCRDRMAAAAIGDVRDPPRVGKMTDEKVVMINSLGRIRVMDVELKTRTGRPPKR